MNPHEDARMRGRCACQEKWDIAEARGMMPPCEIGCVNIGDEVEAGWVEGWNEVVMENT